MDINPIRPEDIEARAVTRTPNPTYEPTDAQKIHIDLLSKAPEKISMFDQKVGSNKEQSFYNSFFQNTNQTPLSYEGESFDIREAYSRQSDGSYITRYNDFMVGTDNEDRHAKRQATSEKWSNGLLKYGLKTGTNVVGAIGGSVYGLFSAIAKGNWEEVYDNDFYNTLDDYTNELDNFYANYRGKEERDLNFGQSLGTANFWADDFLGGMSFLTGTIISEGIMAAATGGTSLSTTALRLGSRFANIGVKATRGINKLNKVNRQFRRMSYLNGTARHGSNAIGKATWGAKATELAKTARFTYTSAGFESGMEARLYEKEQRDAFYDYHRNNGTEPTPEELANFEKELGSATNVVFATNMALVGTSNLAILGKTFNIRSPFKMPTRELNKKLFGKGLNKLADGTYEAIKRTKVQKGFGLTYNVLKNPFMEGFVEEGGQGAISTAMEMYVKGTYDPNSAPIDMMESIYEGLSHQFGSKEGWKEVGLGALIGIIGGEGGSLLSGRGAFTEARASLKDQDKTSKKQAEMINPFIGEKLVQNIIRAQKQANFTEAAQQAEQEGDLLGQQVNETLLHLSSIEAAVETEMTDEMLADIEAALDLQIKNKTLEKEFGYTEEQAQQYKKDTLEKYNELTERYEKARDYTDYLIANTSEKLPDNMNVEMVKRTIAMQMVMTDTIETHANEAFEVLQTKLAEVLPGLQDSATESLNLYNKLSRASKENRKKYLDLDQKLRDAKRNLGIAKSIMDSEGAATNENTEGRNTRRENAQETYNKSLENYEKIQAEFNELSDEMGVQREAASSSRSSVMNAGAILEREDPMGSEEFISEDSVLSAQEKLEKLENALNKLQETRPEQAEEVRLLLESYNKANKTWLRNREVLAEVTSKEFGLDRVRVLLYQKNTLKEDTLNTLKKIQEAAQEISDARDSLIEGDTVDTTTEEAKGDAAEGLETKPQVKEAEETNLEPETSNTVEETPNQTIIKELYQQLKDILARNAYTSTLVDDGTTLEEVHPTKEDLDRYEELTENLKLNDIRKITGDRFNTETATKEELEIRELAKKFSNYKAIERAASKQGVPLTAVLEQINQYRAELDTTEDTNDQEHLEATLEASEVEARESGNSNLNIGQTMSDVVVRVDKKEDQLEIAHMELSYFENNGWVVTNTQNKKPKGKEAYTLYTIEKDGKEVQVRKRPNGNFLVDKATNKNKDNRKDFMELNGFKNIKFENSGTYWGQLLQKVGDLYKNIKGQFSIKSNGEVIMNPQRSLMVKPEDEIDFRFDRNNEYNQKEIKPLVEKYHKEKNQDKKKEIAKEIKEKVGVYMTVAVQDQQGNTTVEVLGFLKAKETTTDNNFNKVRDRALNEALEQYKPGNEQYVELKDMAHGGNAIHKLGYSTTVNKVFPGKLQIEVDQNNTPTFHNITEKGKSKIVGFGYYNKGRKKYNKKPEGKISSNFISKDKKGAFVVIKEGNVMYELPAKSLPVAGGLMSAVSELYQSDRPSHERVVELIKLLRENGIEAAKFGVATTGMDYFKTSAAQALLDFIQTYEVPLREDTVLNENTTIEDLMPSLQLAVDLESKTLSGGKIVTDLSKNLIEIDNYENEVSIEPTPLPSLEYMLSEFGIELLEQKDMVRYIYSSQNQQLIDSYEANKEAYKDFYENNQIVATVIPKESIVEKILNLDADLVEGLRELVSLEEDFFITVEDLSNIGINVTNTDNIQEQIKDFLQTPTEETAANLAEAIEGSIPNKAVISKKEETIEIAGKQVKPKYVKFHNTLQLSKEEIFTNYNLVEVDPNNGIYIKVNKVQAKRLVATMQEMEDTGIPSDQITLKAMQDFLEAKERETHNTEEIPDDIAEEDDTITVVEPVTVNPTTKKVNTDGLALQEKVEAIKETEENVAQTIKVLITNDHPLGRLLSVNSENKIELSPYSRNGSLSNEQLESKIVSALKTLPQEMSDAIRDILIIKNNIPFSFSNKFSNIGENLILYKHLNNANKTSNLINPVIVQDGYMTSTRSTKPFTKLDGVLYQKDSGLSNNGVTMYKRVGKIAKDYLTFEIDQLENFNGNQNNEINNEKAGTVLQGQDPKDLPGCRKQ